MRLAVSSGQTAFSPDGKTFKALSSGQIRLSPDEMTLRALPSGQSRDPPDGMPLRLSHQNHFGSQCATGSVYWHLPAKVRLKKAHFGKPPLIECTLRHPPCQSELAELRERQKPATKSNNDAGPPRAGNTPRGQCHPRLSGGNHFARNGRVRPRGVFCWRATKACHEVEKHLLI